jgi:hypothetical protein
MQPAHFFSLSSIVYQQNTFFLLWRKKTKTANDIVMKASHSSADSVVPILHWVRLDHKILRVHWPPDQDVNRPYNRLKANSSRDLT